MILVISVQALGLATGANLHAESSVDDSVASVGVPGLAVVVVRCLVDEDREESVDEGVNEPFFTCSDRAGDEASAATGFGWEEISLELD